MHVSWCGPHGTPREMGLKQQAEVMGFFQMHLARNAVLQDIWRENLFLDGVEDDGDLQMTDCRGHAAIIMRLEF